MNNKIIKKIDETIVSNALDGDFVAIDSELKSLGYNIEEINTYSEKIYRRQSFRLKGIISKQRDTKLLERASQLLHKSIEDNVDKPISYLKSIIANNQFNVQYRNLENLTIEEIKEIIKDQNLLELLERLENEDQ